MRTALRERRNKLNLTQKIAAQRAGIPESTYKLIELGYRNPTLATAIKIANALHVSLDIFLLENVMPHNKQKKETRIRNLKSETRSTTPG